MTAVVLDSAGVTQHSERSISKISSEPDTHMSRRISAGTENGLPTGPFKKRHLCWRPTHCWERKLLYRGSRSRKHVAGTSLGEKDDCVAQAGDITLNQTWLRQRSTFSVVAVRVAACISGSATLIECVRSITLRKQSAKGPEFGLFVCLKGITALAPSVSAC